MKLNFFPLLRFSSSTYYMGIKCDYLALEDPLESGIIYTFVWFEILCQETTILECTRIVRNKDRDFLISLYYRMLLIRQV